MSAAVSRLLAAKASLPPSSGVPLGLLLGSYYPEAAASEAGGASKGSVHALQWSPLASLSSDPDFQEGADARLASAVADGTLEGLNAADEAATAAVLHLYEEGGCSTKGLPKQPFVLVLLQQHNLQDSVAHFSWMSGNSSWSSLSSATLFPSSSLLRQQQQQMLQLCCSPLSLNLTLLLHPSLMRQHSAATILGTGQLRRALRRALRVFAGLEEAPMGYSRESFPFYCCLHWVRGAVGSLNGSLEEAWGEREGPPSALHVSLHQRRYLTTQHAPLLEQQLKAHGAPAVLAELAPAAEGEEGSERVRVEFLFGGEWRWGVIAALRLFSFADISIENPKGSDAHKDLQNTGALQAEHDRYWKALINCPASLAAQVQTTVESQLAMSFRVESGNGRE
ncbi:hypothetical protein cyc_05294 [Cyclospora cayetanensis]|uniref:Uncharacterized protein n=1 Tax=Cyclospora cayetanensis TaxID=88456 RepID=A0A1D3CU94_9EIME|nr:hypothetical protein cyc_05294 [Cyclospora cayetanensis]